jgi:hypothetical protein
VTTLVADAIAKSYVSGKIETKVLQGISIELAERELTLVLGRVPARARCSRS